MVPLPTLEIVTGPVVDVPALAVLVGVLLVAPVWVV
jgi:hypothetical protein